jgi:two-component system sensor histidine kinase UhpB
MMRRLSTRSRELPLFWQIFAPNAIVLLTASAALTLSPATISSPVVGREVLTVAVGVLLLILVNFLVIRRAVRPVEDLTDVMGEVDLLSPGQRVNLSTHSAEINELGAVFNRMLERLEAERREMGRRTLVAQEDERRRLARELHDELNQTIAGVMLSLKGVADHSDGVEEAAKLREALEELRRVSDEVEAIVNRLRPETLDDLGLLSALVVLSEQFSQRTGIEVRRRFGDGLPTLSPDAELVVYRIAQESLTNVAVHAEAGFVELELAREGSDLRLSVRDDGAGLNGHVEGHGIRGMRERALLVDADLALRAGVGGAGTGIELRVPAAGP